MRAALAMALASASFSNSAVAEKTTLELPA